MALRDGLWSIEVLEFVAVFLLLALNYRVSEAVNSEGLVLQAFKLRLEDPLGALSNWNDSDVTPCKWKGVVCNNVSQVVTFINLPFLSLTGALSPQLAGLKYLESLNLRNNSIAESIPDAIGTLMSLRVLDLANNKLEGSIPESFSNLTNLVRSGVNYQPWVSVFNLCNAVVGAGVLSFPYAFRQSGIYGGLFYTGLIWLIEVGALCILIRAAEINRSRSYQELVTSTLGPRMAVLTSSTILLFVLGAMISFLIITGDVFQPVFAGWFGNDSALSDRRFVITAIAVVVVLPLSLKRSLQELKWTSTISVIMLTYLTVALSTLGVAHLVDDGLSHKIKYFSGGRPAFIAIDIVVFSFHSHIQVIPIFSELAENPWPFIGEGRKPLEERLLPVPEGLNIGRPLTRVRSIRLRRMDGIILISMTICLVGYCLVGEFGYILFPDVESDVLKSFGSDNNFMIFARIGTCLVAIACYPVQCYPARSILEDAIKHVFHRPGNEASWNRHIFVTLLIFISTLVTALLITNLGTVFSIIGATGGVTVIFIIPGLLLIQQGLQQTPPDEEVYTLRERLEESLRWIKLIAGPLFVGLGALIFVVTAYITTKGLHIINPETPVLCQNLVFHHAC